MQICILKNCEELLNKPVFNLGRKISLMDFIHNAAIQNDESARIILSEIPTLLNESSKKSSVEALHLSLIIDQLELSVLVICDLIPKLNSISLQRSWEWRTTSLIDDCSVLKIITTGKEESFRKRLERLIPRPLF